MSIFTCKSCTEQMIVTDEWHVTCSLAKDGICDKCKIFEENLTEISTSEEISPLKLFSQEEFDYINQENYRVENLPIKVVVEHIGKDCGYNIYTTNRKGIKVGEVHTRKTKTEAVELEYELRANIRNIAENEASKYKHYFER